MNGSVKSLIVTYLCLVLFSNCSARKSFLLEFVDDYEIRQVHDKSNVAFGGISGIDYDFDADLLYLVSDDRSEFGPARIYTSKFTMGNDNSISVHGLKVVVLNDSSENPYEKEKADFESVRYLKQGKQYVVSNEGGKRGKAGISFFDENGYWKNDFPLDTKYVKNFRSNKSIESIVLSEDQKTIFFATEAPLVFDGPESSSRHGGLLRIIKADLVSGKEKETWLYKLEKVPQKVKMPYAREGGWVADNGLSELLVLDEEHLLALERSGAYQPDGHFKFICRLFLVKKGKKVKKGDDGETYFRVQKKKLFDFSKMQNGLSNIEGMSLGPHVDNSQTLLFASDNNFKETVPTRFYLFKIKEEGSD
ncbi:esterase-like activity of phytase family protein [Allomuricauda sp. SCSIO 65647]|uniref:esterase-like activity of phytase family protein n=1 Tax=Allomuricauda sp. SCSIO 65647 TaxID=2908843 RepID=UPI001F36CA93|nr:esterase-like activity of phytase family protein [Muricauda sp. SCSIO 65647]UJH67818.1 esterase-like activity of phytase family protein [Muricauda sp. SCSIO 65647]